MALATETIVVVYGARLQRLFVHYSVNLETRNIAREKSNGISHLSETVNERFASDTEKLGGIVSIVEATNATWSTT